MIWGTSRLNNDVSVFKNQEIYTLVFVGLQTWKTFKCVAWLLGTPKANPSPCYSTSCTVLHGVLKQHLIVSSVNGYGPSNITESFRSKATREQKSHEQWLKVQLIKSL